MSVDGDTSLDMSDGGGCRARAFLPRHRPRACIRVTIAEVRPFNRKGVLFSVAAVCKTRDAGSRVNCTAVRLAVCRVRPRTPMVGVTRVGAGPTKKEPNYDYGEADKDRCLVPLEDPVVAGRLIRDRLVVLGR